nr:MAG TPA: hypothetical protein [Caudoviricetes sp.]
MKIREKYLTVSETTEDTFIALETENLNIPEWKFDDTIKALNEIMDWVVNYGQTQEDEAFFKKLNPSLEKVFINNELETISVSWVFNDDRVVGTLYYGAARDVILETIKFVNKK